MRVSVCWIVLAVGLCVRAVTAQNRGAESLGVIRKQVFNKEDLKKALTEAVKTKKRVVLSCESETCPFSKIASKSLFNSLTSNDFSGLMIIKVRKY